MTDTCQWPTGIIFTETDISIPDIYLNYAKNTQGMIGKYFFETND